MKTIMPKLDTAAQWFRPALFSLIFLLTLLLAPTACGAQGGQTVRVGWVPRPGASEVKDGVYSGYTYDYLLEIAKYTGWNYEFVVGDAATLTAMPARGEIDLQGTSLYSEERAQVLAFSDLPAYYCDVEIGRAGLAAEQREIITIVNKGLALINDNERNNISMEASTYPSSGLDMLYQYRLPLFIICLLVLAVVVTLMILNATKRRSEQELQAAFDKEQAAHQLEREALALAEQASAAKGNFMSRMSHEIRTPLNAVIGYNTLARNEIDSVKSAADYRQSFMKISDCLNKSDIASKHLLTIINDVLDMSAIESGRIQISSERFDFRGLISSLTTIFYSQAKAKEVDFAVRFETPTEEWFIGDAMRTNQILTNLLSNAIKFTPEGGQVELAISQLAATESSARMGFTVSDTGIGMSAEYLAHIWTPFEQADSTISRRFGGTGLGLSITKNLVELMGGQIQVSSQPGNGSVFRVELDLQRTAQPQGSGVYDFSQVKALAVDDDRATCEYIQLLFRRFGARCQAVTSGPEALSAFAAAQAQGEPYTLCLVDWRMPQMDGLETIRRLRELATADIPIIVITAYDFSEIADEAQAVGIHSFVAKPLFQSSLFDLLANICGEQTLLKLDKKTDYDFGGSRVLLAEDNAMNMEVAKRILESAQLTVDCAWNGEEAVAAFQQAPAGTYQAILMDVQMPKLDGHQATRQIRACGHPDSQSIPILAMTADAFAENVAQAQAAGMNDHIAKPIEIETLFEKLRKYVG